MPCAPEYKEAFTAALTRLGIGMAELTKEGEFSAVSPRLCELLGHSENDLLGTSLKRFLQLTECEADSWRRRLNPADETSTAAIECRATQKDAARVWLRAAISEIPESRSGEHNARLLLVQPAADQKNAENEHQETAERFINALEGERSRIARELHDDIGHSLALLAVQLHRVGQPVSDCPGKTHPGPRELAEKVQSIASRVSRISHQFDTSKMECLGLSVAIQAECREFSQAQRIPVEYSSNEIPGKLPGDIGLCFLRILQEALHNVAKHSHATKVTVNLSGNPGELRIIVTDNGVGFDTGQARLARGIGLISMRERVRLAGGEFSVESEPGKGARLSARVSLP
jgi:PAS domain S-box-containing protein